MQLITFTKAKRYLKFIMILNLSCIWMTSFGGTVDYLTYENHQAKKISGEVRDSAGVLEGVSVFVQNQPNIGTITDKNGMYTLEVPSDKSILVFQMVGYESQNIMAGNKDIINVVLNQKKSSMDEVVVVAFGTQKKTDVIGAITTINPDELKMPSSNLTTSLAGRLAGVIAYQRSGEPGEDDAAFFIRGVTTFGYKKDPLILIDGVELPSTELARLQPDDIASFSIMKDATATALYGARGANGVILVTTKQGRSEKARINFRYENSLSSPTKNIELADPITYMKLENEAVLTRNPLGLAKYSESKIDNTIAGTNPYVYPSTDWQKELFKDYTHNQRANFSVTGGGEVAQYYIAATFNQDNGVLKVDRRNNFNNNIDLKSYALRSNISINLSKTTKLGVRLYGTFDDYSGPLYGGSTMYARVMRSNPVMFPAYFPVDSAHTHVKHIMFGGSSQFYSINPYADLVMGYKEYSKSLMLAQFELKQDLSLISDGLSFRGMINTNRGSFFDISRSYIPFWYEAAGYDKYSDKYALSNINPNGGTEYLNFNGGDKSVTANLYAEAAIDYNRTFHEKHGISGLLVFNMRNYLQGNATSLIQSLPYRNLGLSGRTTYSFDRRYFAEFNFGYNGSERFSEDHRFGFFPSAGIAWYVSNEKFWNSLNSTVSRSSFTCLL